MKPPETIKRPVDFNNDTLCQIRAANDHRIAAMGEEQARADMLMAKIMVYLVAISTVLIAAVFAYLIFR